MTSRERFDAWAESEAGLAVARYREVAFTGWQARDPEVRELVEALRLAFPDVRDAQHELDAIIKEEGDDSSIAGELQHLREQRQGVIDRINAILAKHESGGE